MRVKDTRVILEVNMRRPRGKSTADFEKALTASAERLSRETHGAVSVGGTTYVGEPHVADVSGPLASTLLSLYREELKTKDAKPRSVRGGTYARLWPGGVDFGPALPNEKYEGHAPNESVSLETLDATTRLVSRALRIVAIEGIPERPAR
jgi:acetylornithine deacetylase/succinyl-diaminopimelate desuccinylase-like protein